MSNQTTLYLQTTVNNTATADILREPGTRWKTKTVSIFPDSGSGGSPANYVQLRNDVYVPAFSRLTRRHAFFSFVLPADYVENSNVYINYNWTVKTDPTDALKVNFTWVLEYTWSNTDSIFPASTTMSTVLSVAPPPVSTDLYKNKVYSFLVSGAGKSYTSVISCHITRPAAPDAAIEYTSDVLLTSCSISYQCDTVSAATRISKT
jgi:hypothetical protein